MKAENFPKRLAKNHFFPIPLFLIKTPASNQVKYMISNQRTPLNFLFPVTLIENQAYLYEEGRHVPSELDVDKEGGEVAHLVAHERLIVLDGEEVHRQVIQVAGGKDDAILLLPPVHYF